MTMTVEVHTVRLSYRRSKQPKEYESAEPTIELTASIQPGDNHLHVMASLMSDAQSVVYGALGVAVPSAIKKKLADLSDPDATVEVVEEPAKKTTKAGTKKAAIMAKKEAAPVDDVPEETGKSITDNPEDRKGPDDDDIPGDDIPDESSSDDIPDESSSDDIPDESSSDDIPDEEEAFTTVELHHMIRELVGGQKIAAGEVKTLLAEHGAARVGDLSPEGVIAVRAALDDKVSG
jgi:hypothetical protein